MYITEDPQRTLGNSDQFQRVDERGTIMNDIYIYMVLTDKGMN